MISKIDQQLLQITVSCQPTQTVSQVAYWNVGPISPVATVSASITLSGQTLSLTSAQQYQPMQPVTYDVQAYIAEYLSEGAGSTFPGPGGGPISHVPNTVFVKFALSASLTLSGTAFTLLGGDPETTLTGYAGTLTATAIATVYYEG